MGAAVIVSGDFEKESPCVADRNAKALADSEPDCAGVAKFVVHQKQSP